MRKGGWGKGGSTADARALDVGGVGHNLVPDAEAVQHAGHVGRHLDAGADEAEVGRVLVDVNVLEPLFRKGQRRP